MNKMIPLMALALAMPAAAIAQQAEPDAMPCCEHDAEGNMTGCTHMQHGDDAVHGDMDHGAMDQGNHDSMNHGTMDHDSMDHDQMDHDQMEHAAPVADPTIS